MVLKLIGGEILLIKQVVLKRVTITLPPVGGTTSIYDADQKSIEDGNPNHSIRNISLTKKYKGSGKKFLFAGSDIPDNQMSDGNIFLFVAHNKQAQSPGEGSDLRIWGCAGIKYWELHNQEPTITT